MAQQQCVGPLQLPISDVAVLAQSHFTLTGGATAIGEQPLKGLIDPAAMARLALGESLTNLVWAASTGLQDVKASVNWMYAAKMDSEGADMYDAAVALRDAMIELQVSVWLQLFKTVASVCALAANRCLVGAQDLHSIQCP